MSEYLERIPACKSVLLNGENALLPYLDMELTERCNNDCIHCWNNLQADDESARSRELPAEEVKRILREAVELGCIQVRFTGGEPLLREDFEELYVFARRLGLKIWISTNARLITPHLADLFAGIPPLAEIEISVYGMKAKSYEGVTRVPGSYAQFRRGASLLLDRNVPFVVSGALLPANRSEMEEFEAWASSIPWMKRPPLYSMLFDLRKRRDSPRKNRQIEMLRIAPHDAVAVLNRRPEEERRSWMEFCLKRMEPTGDSLFRCGHDRGACVDAYGRYQACMSFCAKEWTYDLLQNSLSEALNKLNSRIREARAINPGYLKRCARCLIRPLCDQCPAKSWIESGALDTPVEYLCSAAHVQARSFGLIQLEERAWNIPDWEERTEKLMFKLSSLRSGNHG